ncbi:oligoendopeptidase F [Actimicrobium sp. GrIS 1.19]|uniref:oligoendopeptidase F n=1 Tax=Actimicrobium sp. GrIS 1.19 TaxID=3071708 RepID=UPI002E0B3665|nr:oligoendopeptidase F [Actimicrobium sp. GrIS 1.19]
MQKPVLFLLLALGAAQLSSAAESINPRWNLADVYPSTEAWQADASKLEGQVKEFAGCRGHLGESVKRFKQCMDLRADLSKRLDRLAIYANETHAEDTGNTAGLELNQKTEILGARVEESGSFFRPEILALGQKKVSAMLAGDKSLAIYRQPLDNLLRAAPHTLDAKGEALIASFGLTANSAQSVYSILSNADMPWPKVTLSDGKEVTLDQSGYTQYRGVANRDDRKKVFDAFWTTWHAFERTYGVTFYEHLKQDSIDAKVRNYPDSITKALDTNKIPVAVYNTLIEQTNANLPTLHRYFALRAKLLGIKDMRYYDIYPPLVKGDFKYPIEQGNALMLASVKPLGDDYVKAMEKGVGSRWMDVYPRPRKLSGAHMAGDAYDVHPVILLNYTDDYNSVSTLAHEWGHAMHTVLANAAQPYVTAGYPIFTAEIASTTNEGLLLARMLKISKTDDERLLYLGSALENLRGTFFRQAMFAEFERDVHARVDRGESLTGEGLTKIYGDILRRYHGDKEGVVTIDDVYATEWAFIPHFYNSFYVFQYATSISAGSLFAESILANKPGARERYLGVLKSGSSAYPYELVKAAGVDLATPAPYQAVVASMNRIMDEIEAIVARRKN